MVLIFNFIKNYMQSVQLGRINICEENISVMEVVIKGATH